MTMSPSRAPAVSLVATRNVTFPLPCPEPGVNAEIHAADEEAVQAHSGCVVTATVPLPPSGPMVPGSLSDTSHFGVVTASGLVDTVEDVSVQPVTNTAAASANAIDSPPRDRLNWRSGEDPSLRSIT